MSAKRKKLRSSKKIPDLQLLDKLVEGEQYGGLSQHKALTVFVYKKFISSTWDEDDYTDGGDDKGVDIASIQESREYSTLTLVQTKGTNVFSSTEFSKLANGLDIFLNYPEKHYLRISNKRLVDKIKDFRTTREQFGTEGIKIRIIFATLGDTKQITTKGELIQLQDQLKGRYGGTYKDFSVEIVGFRELIAIHRSNTRTGQKIIANLRLVSNKPLQSSISYQSGEIQAVVCTVPGSEIARIVNEDPSGFLFDMNVRRYLGEKGSVNKDIYSTSINPDFSHRFWFLNNGITIVCDEFRITQDPDRPKVKIENIQIVNGCQTAETLGRASKEQTLQSNVEVLVRIYKTSDKGIIDKIVLSTNNQNKIGNRNLKANDTRQIQLEEAFKLYGYWYERKPHQFDKLQVPKDHIFTNEQVGQAVLAITHRIPSDARARKYKIWSELYDQVFSESPVEPFITSTLLYRRASELTKKDSRRNRGDDILRTILKKGVFHLSLVIALHGNSKSYNNTDIARVETYVKSKSFNEDLEYSIKKLYHLLKLNKFMGDIDKALKSPAFDRKINH